MLFVAAPELIDNCTTVSSTGTSITFTWSPAKSKADVTYYLAVGTTVIASTTTTSKTIGNLAAATNYVYSLYASRSGSDSRSVSVTCAGKTG